MRRLVSGEGLCRNAASTPKNFLVFAGVPANAKAFAARLAGVPANAKAFAAGLAGVPANAKAFPVGLAGVPANAKAFPVGLAGLPQTPKSFSKHLSQYCKHFQKRFGYRVASVKSLC